MGQIGMAKSRLRRTLVAAEKHEFVTEGRQPTLNVRRAAACAALCVWTVLFASVADAQTTALYLDSQPGDFIGQGLEELFTAADLTFAAPFNFNTSVVNISARTPNFSTFWDLTFEAPVGHPLQPGVYENAAPFRFDASPSPALRVTGNGRGCNISYGRFVIHEISFDAGGNLFRFAADFEQHCEGITPALFGAIRYNSARSSTLPFDGDYPVYSLQMDAADHGYVSGPGIDCGAGRTTCQSTYPANTTIVLQAVPSSGYVFLGWAGLDCVGGDTVAITMTRRKFCTPIFNAAPGSGGGESPDYSQGALFLDGRLGTGEGPASGNRIRQAFVELPVGRPTGSGFMVQFASTNEVQLSIAGPRGAQWNLSFAAPRGELLVPGTYQYAVTTTFFRGQVPLLAMSGTGAFCNDGGRFDVYEIAFSSGVLSSFAADFEIPCGFSNDLISGSIRYRSARASLLPFDGAYPLQALHVDSTIGGYVTSAGIDCGDGGRTDCDETYAQPTDVSLQAFPSPGYQFVGWSGGCSDGLPLTTINVNRATRCFAVFTPTAGSGMPADPLLATGTLLIDAPGSSTVPSRSIVLGRDSAITIGVVANGSTVHLSFGSSASFFTVSFGAPGGAQLAPGDYEGASSFGLPSTAHFSTSNCSTTAARFRIYEVSFDATGNLLTFAADFEAFCNAPSQPYIVGAVRFNSNRSHILPFDGAYPIFKLTIDPAVNGIVTADGIDCGPGRPDCAEVYGAMRSVSLLAAPAPGFRFIGWGGACDGAARTTVVVNWIRRCHAVFNSVVPGFGLEDPRARSAALFIDSQPGDPVGGGRRHVWLDASISPASFTRGTARLLVNLGEGMVWSIELYAPGTEELRPGLYENAVHPFRANVTDPSISILSPEASCPLNSMTGRFLVHEITFESPSSGVIASLAADFEQRCSPGAPALFGSIRFHSSRSDLRPFPLPPTSHGRGDVNGDGGTDLVWQNRADGRLAVWFMSGTAHIGNTAIVPDQVVDTAWHVVGTGDGNRDGQVDLYWQNQATGGLAIWFMFDNVRVSAEMLMPAAVPDTSWKVRTVTDLDGDGYPDLIWQHSDSGDVAVWFMVGTRRRSGELLVPGQVSDLDWKIVGAGDVDRDGNQDLFWHHAVTGQLAVWFMRGNVAISGQAISPDRVIDTAWQVRGVGDLDGNGYPDLVWQNTSTFKVATWLLNGLQRIDGRLIAGPALPSADWYVVSPK